MQNIIPRKVLGTENVRFIDFRGAPKDLHPQEILRKIIGSNIGGIWEISILRDVLKFL